MIKIVHNVIDASILEGVKDSNLYFKVNSSS